VSFAKPNEHTFSNTLEEICPSLKLYVALFKGAFVIVYKLNSYSTSEMVRGLVTSETAKQYKVLEWSQWGSPEWSKRESTWRKCDCFATIESASDALIARCEGGVVSLQKSLDRAKSHLDLARKWARREAVESAKLPLTAAGVN
jgi:hypothetical protein